MKVLNLSEVANVSGGSLVAKPADTKAAIIESAATIYGAYFIGTLASSYALVAETSKFAGVAPYIAGTVGAVAGGVIADVASSFIVEKGLSKIA